LENSSLGAQTLFLILYKSRFAAKAKPKLLRLFITFACRCAGTDAGPPKNHQIALNKTAFQGLFMVLRMFCTDRGKIQSKGLTAKGGV
jgi:ribosomal protein S18